MCQPLLSRRASIRRSPRGGRQEAQHDASCRGFSLLELLAVVAIIGLLAGLMSPVVSKAREKARQADCKSNLRQFGTALVVYRADHDGANPGWMSNLYPEYIDDKSLYTCKSDLNRGQGRNRPAFLSDEAELSQTKYAETIDNASGARLVFAGGQPANTDIRANSYFYEFSTAECSLRPGETWAKYKQNQLANGDAASENQPYSTSRMPIIRCYHHANRGKIPAHPGHKDGTVNRNTTYEDSMTLNVAYAGNVFVAPLWWEGRVEPGWEKNP